MHVARGLQQALLLLLLTAVLCAVPAVTWWLLRGDFLRSYALCLMGVGGLAAVTGGTDLSRLVTTDARALLGAGPDREAPAGTSGLGPVGVFLFVAAPLVGLGLLLLDTA